MEFDGSVETFVDKLKPYAQKAAAALGLQPQALLAQAALETGWGKSQMKMADGKPSFNLFGIKADTRWDGKQAAVSTLEFRDGVAKREKASFRAYDSYQQAFDDYAKFIAGEPSLSPGSEEMLKIPRLIFPRYNRPVMRPILPMRTRS